MPLRYSGERDIPGLNRWADDIENKVQDVDEIARKANLVSQDAIVLAEASGDIPPDPTSCAVSGAVNVVDGVVYNLLTCTYNAPNPLGTFAGLFLVVSGYKGSTTLVKVGESTYTGPAGGPASLKVNLERTGETITCYFVARTSTEVSRPDWNNAPSRTITLNAYPSNPSPLGLTAIAEALGVRLTWSEVAGTHITGYNVYRFTSNSFGSASKIATVPATNGTGVTTFFDKSASVNTLYYYWIGSVSANDNESTIAGPVSSAGIGPGTHSSYRPLTNPLTGHDAGATATVNIAAFTMRIGGLDVAYNSGSVTSLSYSTVYYIYFADATFVGGAVSYLASTTKETILNSYGQLYVGSIRTPVAGTDDTLGFNDGGSGAQSGNLFVMSPTLVKDTVNADATFVPIRNSYGGGDDADGNTTTKVLYNSVGTRIVSGWPAFYFNWVSLTLKMKTQVVSVGSVNTVLGYSLDNGATFTNVYTVTAGNTRATTTDSVTLATNQNPTKVQVKFDQNGIGSNNLYEWWIEGQI